MHCQWATEGAICDAWDCAAIVLTAVLGAGAWGPGPLATILTGSRWLPPASQAEPVIAASFLRCNPLFSFLLD